MHLIKNTKGFYTLEAAIFLPAVLLAVLSLGYFMRIEGTWENCIHGAADESALIASRSYDGVSYLNTGSRLKKRISEDNPHLESLDIRNLRIMYSDGFNNALTSYRIIAAADLSLPMGFERRFHLDFKIKYRGFTGKSTSGTPLGISALETPETKSPVWIFPNSGEKYHSENCTYVKASVTSEILSSALRRKYDPCGLCNSADLTAGSIVFCFSDKDSAYHRGTCRSIKRQTIIVDKTDAQTRDLTPCSKCGG